MANYAVLLVADGDRWGRPVGSVADATVIKEGQTCPPNRTEMTEEELDALRTQFSNATAAYRDSARLAEVKQKKLRVLKAQLTSLVESRYSDAQQRSLTMLYQEAAAKNYPQRLALVQSAVDWIKSTIASYYTLRASVNAATTIEAVEAVEIDVAAMLASDPRVDLSVVLGMNS